MLMCDWCVCAFCCPVPNCRDNPISSCPTCCCNSSGNVEFYDHRRNQKCVANPANYRFVHMYMNRDTMALKSVLWMTLCLAGEKLVLLWLSNN